MAHSNKNIVIHGMSGKLGDILVFRQRSGKTIAAQAPGERPGEGTVAQQAIRSRFQRAVVYAKAAIADPTVKATYQAAAGGDQSAYNVAIADFFHAPDILSIDISRYTGQPGQTISLQVTDDFLVKTVKLSIHNEDGSLVEEGNAVKEANGLDWVYTTTAANAATSGDRIVVTASDNADNLSSYEQTL